MILFGRGVAHFFVTLKCSGSVCKVSKTALLAISIQMNINIYFCVNVFSSFSSIKTGIL